MSKAGDHPGRIEAPWGKWSLVIGYWIVQALLAYLLWPLLLQGRNQAELISIYMDAEYALWMFLTIGWITALQATLLVPVRRPRPALHAGCSAVPAAIGGVGLGLTTLYLVLLALALLDSTELLRTDYESAKTFALATAAAVAVLSGAWLGMGLRGGMPAIVSVGIMALAAAHLVLGAVLIGMHFLTFYNIFSPPSWAWPIASLGTLAASWTVGTVLMVKFCRRGNVDDALARIASRIFLGTIVETAAVIPLDIMVRRRTNCYCGEATFLTLTICWGVGSLALGPAIWLLPLAKRRKRWYGGLCDACGYDMSGCMPAERCPECGAGWRRSCTVHPEM